MDVVPPPWNILLYEMSRYHHAVMILQQSFLFQKDFIKNVSLTNYACSRCGQSRTDTAREVCVRGAFNTAFVHIVPLILSRRMRRNYHWGHAAMGRNVQRKYAIHFL